MVEIKSPLSASLQITTLCNLKCKYCYGETSYSDSLSLAMISEILHLFKEKTVFKIEIEGGEPFLHPDIFEIIRNCLELELDFTILTNGTQIDREAIIHMKKLPEESLDSHIPQVNNLTRGEGNKVLEAIEGLLNAGLSNIMIATVVHSSNIEVADKIVDYFYPGIKQFHFMTLMPTKNSLQYKDSLFLSDEAMDNFWKKLEAKKDIFPDARLSYPCNCEKQESVSGTAACNGCFGGITRIAITPRGDIIPCPIAPSFVFGNLKNNNFDEIWNSSDAEKLRAEKRPFCKIEEEIILNS
jgi:MoaA/NifB/PqqE/SkfB family radical SAM enzyme